MAWRAFQTFKLPDYDSDNFGFRGTDAITLRCKDWPETNDIYDDFSVALGFSAAAFIYGGLPRKTSFVCSHFLGHLQ